MAASKKTSVLITGYVISVQPIAANGWLTFLVSCTPGGIGHALALEFHKRGTYC